MWDQIKHLLLCVAVVMTFPLSFVGIIFVWNLIDDVMGWGIDEWGFGRLPIAMAVSLLICGVVTWFVSRPASNQKKHRSGS